MKESSFEEIEMQTYSINYSYPDTYPIQLPYQWDGECHLTLNHTFYESPEPTPISNFSDQSFLEEEKDDEKRSSGNSPLLSAMDLDDLDKLEEQEEMGRPRTESFISIGTLSTNETNGTQKDEHMDTIDDQLEFILKSIKKQKKPEPRPKLKSSEKKRHTRKRKTIDQLAILQKEVNENDVLNRVQIKALADKTGLKVCQVYKWYWDNKKRLDDY